MVTTVGRVPAWVTAFLDSPADAWDASREFWTAVTGYELSAARGEHGDFQTLLPPDGDGYLRVQRLHDGGPRVHLDLHVEDLRAAADVAVGLGAVEVAASDHIVMSSPGGLPFCFVAVEESRRPAPASWTAPDGTSHRSAVHQVAIDIPAGHWPSEVEFWSRVTGWARPRVPGADAETVTLRPPSNQPLRLLPHRRTEATGPVRAHLDVACTDRAAEAGRHRALGARVVREGPDWTALLAPDGRYYCLTESPT